MGQKDFGNLFGKSAATIQAIELKKLKLSKGLAYEIAHKTGIKLSWLLDEDATALPLSSNDEPYTINHFKLVQAGYSDQDSDVELAVGEFMIAQNAILLRNIARAAAKQKKLNLFFWELSQFVQAQGEQFGVTHLDKQAAAEMRPLMDEVSRQRQKNTQTEAKAAGSSKKQP